MILRSPIFRKLLVAALLLILVSLGSADFLLTRYTAGRELKHAEQRMEQAARILAPALAAVDPSALEEWARLMDQRSRSRVTIIDRQGSVLADSQHDAATMENHAGRPEIQAALAGRQGTAVRHSATLDVDFCYLAVPAVMQGQSAGVLRLAVPLEQISTATAEVRRLMLRASLFAGILALLIAYFLSLVFARRVRRIQTFAQELVSADYSGTLAAYDDDELGEVARCLRGMAEQFRGMLSRLAQEASQRRAILASMVEGVLAVDGDLHVTFCNDSLGRAVGAQAPLPEGLPLLRFIRDLELRLQLERVIATGEISRQRMALPAAGGRIFDVQAAPLDQHNRRGALAILHDVTELERIERARKDFVANISHELRTPLAVIRGYAETLLSGALEDTGNARKFLEIIHAHTVRLGDLASQLADLCELEFERTPPPEERVSVREAIQSAILAAEAEAVSRDVCTHMGEVQDLYIRGQRFRLERALLNLLRNAVEFNRPGGEVLLAAKEVDGKVQITVNDTGIGIPSTDLPRIFERFYCVDKARSEQSSGAGLGLSIVKHIVEKMSGTVGVESRLGRGSTFTLWFPAA
jgi:two-component system phosphate regulon sensor histidine kinase PhoR